MTHSDPNPALAHTAFRRTGHGPCRVLLLHALTGGVDAADRPGVKGWWGPLFQPGAVLAADQATVWTPNLLGSCYGSTGPTQDLSPRHQAEALAAWIRHEQLHFEALVGGSLGGMVALELALLLPEAFATVAVIGCGGRADPWLWAQNQVQRAILEHPALADDDAIALARGAAMLSFRSPASLASRFTQAGQVQAWLQHHGQALAARFTRASYLALLNAMDRHDLGRDRGGLAAALGGLQAPLWILGLEQDQLFTPAALEELAEAARAAGQLGGLAWLHSCHGHDAFLMEWPQVGQWLEQVLAEVRS